MSSTGGQSRDFGTGVMCSHFLIQRRFEPAVSFLKNSLNNLRALSYSSLA